MGYDEAISAAGLNRATCLAAKSVKKKANVMDYYSHRLLRNYQLRQRLLSGKYHIRKGQIIKIYRPKYREALAPRFVDKVWHRSMCEHGVYDDYTSLLLHENYACQKGKGTDLVVHDICCMLRDYYNTYHDNKLIVVHTDIKQYFPSTPHKVIHHLDRIRISDNRFIPYLDEITDSYTLSERNDAFGPRGISLGSEVNQLRQTSLIHESDLRIKSICTLFYRYMDDSCIFHRDNAKLREVVSIATADYAALGLQLVVKSGYQHVGDGFDFVGRRFILTATGKIIIRFRPGVLAAERNVLRGLKKDLDEGAITYEYVQIHYQCWIAYASYCGDGPIRSMDAYYTQLFRRRPEYKKVRRNLMINYTSQAEARELRQKNALLEAKLERYEALLEYTAMMTDVELPEDAELDNDVTEEVSHE